MNVTEANQLKARITALEERIEELFSLLSPQNDKSQGGQQSQDSTLATKRGPGRPRKTIEASA